MSGFFSGSEVAFFSLDKKKVDKHFNQHKLLYRYVGLLINFPRRLLVTILIGNTLVNVGLSILAVLLVYEIASTLNINLSIAIIAQIIVTTSLVLIFGELIPKMIATNSPIKFARISAIPLYIISTIFYPISELITELIRIFLSKIKFDKSRSALSKDEISELASLSTEKGAIDENEKEIINSIVEFRETTVQEIMTPRVDIVAISEKKSIDEAIQIISQSGHSRIPVYRENIDSITGIIHAKDLLEYVQKEEQKRHTKVSQLLKKVFFVPESKKISDLLQEFQSRKVHLAIVVDEYGGTAGLVTLEDIIEEVVGDIWDEYDKAEKDIQVISEQKFLLRGNLLLEDLYRETGIDLIDDNNPDIDTVAGLILQLSGDIPSEGETFFFKGMKFTVKRLDKKRILKVLLEKDIKES